MNQSITNPPNTADVSTSSNVLIKQSSEDLNNSTQNLLKIAEFITLRQRQKTLIKQNNENINSLSKNNNLKVKNTKENKETPYETQAIYKLIALLNEQLTNGHTIYYLPKSNARQQQLFTTWQSLGWLSVISNYTQLTNPKHTLNTPIVMQVLNAASPEYPCVFWLHRQWYAEYQLAQNLLNIAQRSVEDLTVGEGDFKEAHVDKNSLDSRVEAMTAPITTYKPNTQQQQAINQASQNALTIITGGPGTGKTFTVAQLVTKLQQAHERKRIDDPNLPPLSIALTAPTGKAAQRMQSSLAQSLGSENVTLENAKTLHRLLGIGKGGSPRYHANNPLPDDLVIVDEASMLGLELASLLVAAIKPTGRLILLGDANQLSAVDAGSVLADLYQVPALQSYRTQLVESVRFNQDSSIGKLAAALQIPVTTPTSRLKKLQDIHALLLKKAIVSSDISNLAISHEPSAIPFYALDEQTNFYAIYKILAASYGEFFDLMRQWYVHSPNIEDEAVRAQLFSTFDQYRVLTAGHQGQLGAQNLNKMLASEFFYQTNLTRTRDYFYHGLPIMITRNDYQLGLFNGDIGICLLIQGNLMACFPEKIVATNRLSLETCEPAYAMTIHKSQGSEFNEVAICLDKQHARLLSQELIYTAVTRSRNKVMIVSEPKMFDRAILQKGNRQTGLQLQFEHLTNEQ